MSKQCRLMVESPAPEHRARLRTSACSSYIVRFLQLRERRDAGWHCESGLMKRADEVQRARSGEKAGSLARPFALNAGNDGEKYQTSRGAQIGRLRTGDGSLSEEAGVRGDRLPFSIPLEKHVSESHANIER
jgi:hypothetical protein